MPKDKNKLDITIENLYDQVYKNAIDDRVKATELYDDLAGIIIGVPENHAVQGIVIAKYLERISRSTDQLIKVLEIKQNAAIAASKNKATELSDEEKEELYSEIQQTQTVDSGSNKEE